jgi:hypothetical protein
MFIHVYTNNFKIRYVKTGQEIGCHICKYNITSKCPRYIFRENQYPCKIKYLRLNSQKQYSTTGYAHGGYII